MEMTGEQIIDQPQSKVWEALNDPAVLKDCIPGCDTLERVSDTEYKMTMTAAVGPVRAKFNGKLNLSEVNPPVSYTIAFEGSGGAAGFGKGSAQVALAPEGNGTKLSYSAKAQIGGKLAQVGARLIDGVAKKMADDFFSAFKKRLTPVAAEAPATAAPTADAASPAADVPAPKMTPLVIFGIALVVIIVLYFALK
ncbi:MAG: carbon monoxide dehydrogenase [Betaproteobacteria bacterium]|nr:carbon monoxide dehydrogenase [Betaproteobacteria bacterium]